MSDRSQPWRDRISISISGSFTQAAQLASHPWVKPWAGRMSHPQLWRPHREAIGRGAAVGTFWAFVIPFAQTVVAAIHCCFWRANIPTAAVMTMVTNPLTIGFWLWLAYQVGTWALGNEPSPLPTLEGMSSWISVFGLPTLLGMALFAVGGAALSYFAAKLVWRVRTGLKWQGRRTRNARALTR